MKFNSASMYVNFNYTLKGPTVDYLSSWTQRTQFPIINPTLTFITLSELHSDRCHSNL